MEDLVMGNPGSEDFLKQDDTIAFLEGKSPRIVCDNIEKRNSILNILNAKPLASNYIAKEPDKTIYMRETGNPEISVEDRVPVDSTKPTLYYIYRKPDDSKE
ncbi:MAG: hypothetical protein PHG60_01965 [Candidatus Dojkabacteria bacterium]|jgi:hypothetical protein|nr:hypothetical protein [Candidatus Dojkabacteria bacterium]MDD2270324.1 hypothetical protein [Candidatus Dojkabacteria bacterium]